MDNGKVFIAIDLKSFYASVECIDRGLDPLAVNLVVADETKTEKTICLAVSPSLKSYGIPGRARLFEVVQQVEHANAERRKKAPKSKFIGSSYNSIELKNNPGLSIDYVVAPPRMARYMEISTRIYQVYLKHVAPEDIHVYSIDEVFIDATQYLKIEGLSPREFTQNLIKEVLDETGITATAGIGTNLYLCKVAMDIVAKHVEADELGVRIAELDEKSYRRLLWGHRPLTDFWRVGKGYEEKLEAHGLYTMGDVARCSLGKPNSFYNEGLLYKLFGVNAELLIDHAWGWEPCTMADIKAYRPSSNSISVGQVLSSAYGYEKTKTVIMEMADALSLDLVDKGLVTDQIILTVGYDIDNLILPEISNNYSGEITTDHYGRRIPKHAHGTENLPKKTSSSRQIIEATKRLFERIINKDLLTRRMYLVAGRVVSEEQAFAEEVTCQLNFFTDYREEERNAQRLKKEKDMQKTVLNIKKKYGKNSILKGMSFKEGATAKERNSQIGGHKA